jgi:glutamine---fructose-6-phosphate transaminase (isomerizing)
MKIPLHYPIFSEHKILYYKQQDFPFLFFIRNSKIREKIKNKGKAMCGIFGYIGKKNALHACLQGIKHLEYRGYDSAGIAGIHTNKVIAIKEVGKIDFLEKKLSKHGRLKLDVAIGHTRWATHGEPNMINAHPHCDIKSSLALVHNGIIENYTLLKKMLFNKGLLCHSDTDSEVIANLISFHFKTSLLQAVIDTTKKLKGSLAIALIHRDFPNQIIAACRESPIAIGYDDDKTEILISSDPNAFLGRNLQVLFLRNDEIAVIQRKSIKIYNQSKVEVTRKTERLNSKNMFPSKDGFEHFMLKEIYEQPVTIQKAMFGHYSDDFGTAEFTNLNFTTQELMATKHIQIIACGTSWHAGCIGAAMLEDKARIPSQAEIASELRFKNPIISDETLVIAISQSGETADTIAAVREAKAKGAKILGICNVKNSTLTRESDSCIFLKAGPEFSVCSTKAFTSQITVLSLFSLYMARLRHMGKEEGQVFLKELKKIPDKIKEVLDNVNEIKRLAKKYSHYDNFFFLGRRYMYIAGLEAALKLKEISYLNANGYPAGEMKHGPIALINPEFPIIAFCANKQTYEKMISNLMEVKARKGPILAFAPKGTLGISEIADDVLWLPPTIDELATFPSSVAGQLLAYYIAKIRGTEIDHPRNLAKSVTVE